MAGGRGPRAAGGRPLPRSLLGSARPGCAAALALAYLQAAGGRGEGAAPPSLPPPPGSPPGSPPGPRSVLRLQATAAGTARAQGEAWPAGRSEEGAEPPGAAQNPLSSPRPPPRPSLGPPPPPGRGREGLGKVTRPAASSASVPGGSSSKSKDVRSRTSFWGGEAGDLEGGQKGRGGSVRGAGG